MQYPAPDGKEDAKKPISSPGEEVEGFMLVDKEDKNVLKSVGFTATGNPRFIFFSEKEVKRFILGEPGIKKKFEVTKVILRIVE